MVVTFEAILNSDELAAIRRQLVGAGWATGVSAGPQAVLVKNNEQLPESTPALRELRVLVMRALNRSPELLSAALPNKILPPDFNRYAGGSNAYGMHADATLRSLPDGSWLRTDISATLFLSDPADYDGGELCIEDTYGEQQIKLPAGSLVTYPSGSIHQVRPVTRGERLACYFFMQSVIKSAERRRQLYDMDCALRRLRGRLGEAEPELVRLTALYNNLIREWAEC
ncbi:Fe2+-dependent dioxygenase [Solimonas sp. SE-A11]|uniref:Fe2+-dependent dioxygenase n=1 Tax=Solimonas sp. SE-A11 TaxID=3054954 RepID=UPI00259CE5D3|nr:Fe2+-dependent dioxygenase [Solimonas sp. SE-A11]MDM4771891.1 Fe2+-dependent dioxygenase [Solimonas sp. SE-A11]